MKSNIYLAFTPSFYEMHSLQKYLLVVLFSSSAFSFAQNLVPNPSFEQYDTCPNNQDQLNYAAGWRNFNQYSPDYFNSCNPCTTPTAGCFSVPYNWGGWQPAATGNAYAGVYTMEDTPPYNIRECIGIQLISPMILSTKYYASFKVNLSLTSNSDFNTATDKLGMLFSTIQYSSNNPAPIGNFAHIYTTTVITDTASWTTINGSIIADSTYQYLVIGNFFDDTNTNSTRLLFDSNILGAYYFIDDVCVSTDSIGCLSGNGTNSYETYTYFSVYPNPASAFITIEIQSQLKQFSEIILFNELGMEVKKMKIKVMGSVTIPTSDLNNGIYYLQIKTSNEIFTKKIIIN